jgi:HAD superfamily hydrolase (TIGR01484 family)
MARSLQMSLSVVAPLPHDYEEQHCMRYLTLACDYDGTIAHHGIVDDSTVAALARLRETGRRLVLVTGRELDDLTRVFPHLHLFDRVVAENGALLYCPADRTEQPLGEHPPEAFVQALRARNVDPLSVGRVIVATWEPNETTVLEAIRDLGLELQVIFNKGAVMVLPSGINKASGLQAALTDLGISPHNAVGVGDAENDHAFLSLCECSVAVANALPMLKERADWVTRGGHGAGVAELIDALLANDLQELEPRLGRHHILLGTRDDGTEIRRPSYGGSMLLAGSSGSGKSTLATGFLEQLAAHGYQFCIIDPEGDYEAFAGAVCLGDSEHEPRVDELLELLEKPEQHLVVNLLGVKLDDRPAYFEQLLPQLQQLRARTGRPHWIVVDEAHHMLPSMWDAQTLPQALDGMLLITVHPDHVAPAALEAITMVIAVGQAPEQILGKFSAAVQLPSPDIAPVTLEAGEALAWTRGQTAPFRFRIAQPQMERRRHQRKYAQGELGEDKSFYFRGPEGKLNLRAQNLVLFMQLADGLDDATWLYHLARGDYSRWFGEAIKDEELAAEAAHIEAQPNPDAAESRAHIRAAIEQRYTLAA